MDLHQGNVANYHAYHIRPPRHVAQIHLRGETRGKAHVQIALQTKQRRDQNEQFANVLEDVPFLQTSKSVLYTKVIEYVCGIINIVIIW